MDTRRPILKTVRNLQAQGDTLSFERQGRVYELSGPPGLDRLLARMDGSSHVHELGEGPPWHAAAVSELVTQLYGQGLVGFEDEKRTLTGAEFWELHNGYCREWLDRIAEQGLWPALTSGSAHRAVAIGYVIEKYHYIEGAYEHMAIAAANADPRIQVDLTEHFIQEYAHGDIYLRGLTSLFPREAVVRSVPLPSTRALVNCLCELAQTDSFAYYAANEFLQKTENVGDGLADPVEAFYQALEANYDLPPAICNAMRAHTAADQALEHQDVFWNMCSKLDAVPTAIINRYLGATRMIVEHLEYFLTGILTFYTMHPYLPRAPASLRTE